jgi:hypothetical protein
LHRITDVLTRLRGLLVLAGGLVVVVASIAVAEPVKVRVPEGPLYSVVVLKSMSGTILAHGEASQTLAHGLVDSRLVFRFRDGSLFDETVVFSQRGAFEMVRYRLVQRGRSFPESAETAFVRASGQYTARLQKGADKAPDVREGRLDMPADLYNGMSSILLKNLRPGESARGHLLAFTPEPRILTLELDPVGEDAFHVGPVSRKAVRYRVKPELGGMMGVLAAMVGKDPPSLSYWITAAPVRAFLKFEGPFFLNGPIWRVELAGPRWPN